MKIPVSPPDLLTAMNAFVAEPEAMQRFVALAQRLGPEQNGRYRHWDTFRHEPPVKDYSATEQWAAVKFSRQSLYRALPLSDTRKRPFQYAIPNAALEMLHLIDRNAAGNFESSDQVTNPTTRDSYLFKSVVEEAITSSQLEGASTTRHVAKAMIQEGRAPRNRSDRMILNNYDAMLYIREFFDKPLTPAIVKELQKRLTVDTLNEPEAAGRFRNAVEDIVIEDETGIRLHTPPPASELDSRMEAMCAFANGDTKTEFIPPAIRAIILHFWLAYDHPFVDGNGRTARALFYWSMARQGYWLCEYISISRILKKARGKYARAFLYTETDDNDLTYFMLYQMRVLVRAIDELHVYLARKASELGATEVLMQSVTEANGLNHRQIALLGHALKKPATRFSVQSHRISHGVSYETARSDLARLAALGFMSQRKLGKAHIFVPDTNLSKKLQPAPAKKSPSLRRR